MSIKPGTRGGVRKYYPCVYKGTVYTSLNAAANDSPHSAARFSQLYRGGKLGADFTRISVDDYEKRTGKTHPSREMHQTKNKKSLKHKVKDIRTNRLISNGWPINTTWSAQEGEV